jgi:hypothetical protein
MYDVSLQQEYGRKQPKLSMEDMRQIWQQRLLRLLKKT